MTDYEIEGIKKIVEADLILFAACHDGIIREAYRRYCNLMLSANWLEPTPAQIRGFIDWASTTNLDLVKEDMRPTE